MVFRKYLPPIKIENAVLKAYVASGYNDCFVEAKGVAQSVTEQIVHEVISVEEVQDLVEQTPMQVNPEVAKRYIIYREWRNTERQKKSTLKKSLDGIVTIDQTTLT